MKKFLVFMFSILLFQVTTAKADNDKVIKAEQLPAAAQTFIKKYFPKAEIMLVKSETSLTGTQYEVTFTNGDNIDFDKTGQWTEIECKKEGVPTAIIPQQISTLISKRFPKTFVTRIERDKKGYDIELSNQMELEFDKNFNLISVDD
ncbi:MAG: PepSY-like domain-containing protein [Marinifilaceae bacterium]